MDCPTPEDLKRRAAEILAAAEDVWDPECRDTLYQLALHYEDLANKLAMLSPPQRGSDRRAMQPRP